MEVQDAFVAVLSAHHKDTERWHYALNLPSSNANSFSSLLDLTDDEYKWLLETIGLISVEKDTGKVLVKRRKWELFLNSNGFGNTVYFQTMTVSKVPTGSNIEIEEVSHRGYWLGLGHKRDPSRNPSSQFAVRRLPPRRSKDMKDAIRKLKVVVRNNQPISNKEESNEVSSINESACKDQSEVSNVLISSFYYMILSCKFLNNTCSLYFTGKSQ